MVCGLTGTGKSRLLRELARRGAQVLDLEALAAHRGSVLGDMPDEPQPHAEDVREPAVERAEAALAASVRCSWKRESRKIGSLRVPEALIDAMWTSECVVLDAPVPAARRAPQGGIPPFRRSSPKR